MRWDRMVHRGDGFIGTVYLQATLAESCEGLRGGYFMNQMKVNIQDSRGRRLLGYNVRIPYFFEEGFWHIIDRWH